MKETIILSVTFMCFFITAILFYNGKYDMLCEEIVAWQIIVWVTDKIFP